MKGMHFCLQQFVRLSQGERKIKYDKAKRQKRLSNNQDLAKIMWTRTHEKLLG